MNAGGPWRPAACRTVVLPRHASLLLSMETPHCFPTPETWTDLCVDLTDGEQWFTETLIDRLGDDWHLCLNRTWSVRDRQSMCQSRSGDGSCVSHAAAGRRAPALRAGEPGDAFRNRQPGDTSSAQMACEAREGAFGPVRSAIDAATPRLSVHLQALSCF